MEIKNYKKDSFYSYTLGAFPSIELLKYHSKDVIKIILHSSFSNEDAINILNECRGNAEMIINDKMISKLSQKENCYVAAVFNKYKMTLNENENHILLVNPMNMGNFGTIIRSALGFGFKDIAIIKPAIDIFDPKVLRAAMGAFFHCNITYFNNLEEYKAKYPTHKLYAFMLQAKTQLHQASFDTSSPITLVFGNESSGLPETYLDENSIIINHSSEIDSLNLPTAVGIALYEANRQIKK